MRKHLENGSLSGSPKNLVEQEKMYLLLGHIVWYAFIYGVYGSTGRRKDE
jgi:hypothetical protein